VRYIESARGLFLRWTAFTSGPKCCDYSLCSLSLAFDHRRRHRRGFCDTSWAYEVVSIMKAVQLAELRISRMNIG
jgi:hypothetical protein